MSSTPIFNPPPLPGPSAGQGAMSAPHRPRLHADGGSCGTRTGPEWEGEALSDDDIKSGEHLRMRAHDVTIGDVDEIEEFCCTNDLPFVCWTDGSAGSFNPETIIWVGEGPRHSFNATGDSKTLISEEEARELGSYEAILKHFALGSFEPPVLTIVPTNS
jgi:hypothetical protein